MQANSQEIGSFNKCVSSKYCKHEEPIIKNRIVQKRIYNRVVKYEEIFYFLEVMFNIILWTEEKFPEIVQRIYNAIFASVCQIYLTRTKRQGKNSTWVNDLFPEHQKEQSKVVHKMEVVPLRPKRVKRSQIKDYQNNW